MVGFAFPPRQKERNEISPWSPRARRCKPHDQNTCPSDTPSLKSDRGGFRVGPPNDGSGGCGGGGGGDEGGPPPPPAASGASALSFRFPPSLRPSGHSACGRMCEPRTRQRPALQRQGTMTHRFQTPATLTVLGTPPASAPSTSTAKPA